ncbi:C40 family peptidase [Dermacoccaceae bacterium W4C1]
MTRRDVRLDTPESHSPSRRLVLGGAVAGAAALALPVATAGSAHAAGRITKQGARNSYWTARYKLAGNYPYVYGGASPETGFDCSGLTQYCCRRNGLELPRTSSAQYAGATKISADEAEWGDLVFYLDGGSVYHVGFHANPGMIVDAGNPSTDISYRKIYANTVRYGTYRF